MRCANATTSLSSVFRSGECSRRSAWCESFAGRRCSTAKHYGASYSRWRRWSRCFRSFSISARRPGVTVRMPPSRATSPTTCCSQSSRTACSSASATTTRSPSGTCRKWRVCARTSRSSICRSRISTGICGSSPHSRSVPSIRPTRRRSIGVSPLRCRPRVLRCR